VVEPEPKWSIVVPLYNMRGTIGRTVASILAQTKDCWELVVVDDGSSDESAAVVRAFDDPRIVLVEQENAGEGAARNRGIETARASLITFVDADDYWAPNHLENLQSLVDEFPGAVLYATAYRLVFGRDSSRVVNLRPGMPSRGLVSDYFRDCVDFEVLVCASGVASRREALERVGCFPVGVHAGADLITWSRLACQGALAFSTDPTAYVDAPPVDLARRSRALRRPQHPDYVGDALARLAEEHPTRAPSINRYRAWCFRIRALAFVELGERRKALEELTKATRVGGLEGRDLMIAALCMMPDGARTRLLSRMRLRRRRRLAEMDRGAREAGEPVT
jgi:glycosyltransferase involved in cell wall biosynthesis